MRQQSYLNLSTRHVIEAENAYQYAVNDITIPGKDKEEFNKEFPEYQNYSSNDLLQLSEWERNRIEDWFYSGNWLSLTG